MRFLVMAFFMGGAFLAWAQQSSEDIPGLDRDDDPGISLPEAPAISEAPMIPETPAAPPATTSLGPCDGNSDQDVQIACQYVNAARISNGVSDLTFNSNLNRLALEYAKVLYSRNNGICNSTGLSHTLAGSFGDRMARGGVSASAVAENIACGDLDSRSVVSTWLSSPGHRRNMLNGAYSYQGLARYGAFWVEIFSD